MVSDTPICDSTPHNVADLAMLCRRLERKLAATRKYLSEVSERAKRLEEAGDAILNANNDDEEYEAIKHWNKAKEAKP
jgi:hypothetical protein